MGNEKNAAPEVEAQKQPESENFFIVEVSFLNCMYYLADFEMSITKNIRDSILIKSEDNACKIATKIEDFYKNSLGTVKRINLNQLL